MIDRLSLPVSIHQKYIGMCKRVRTRGSEVRKPSQRTTSVTRFGEISPLGNFLKIFGNFSEGLSCIVQNLYAIG